MANHSSKQIEKLITGTYYEQIVGFLRHGVEKAPLSPETQQIFDRVEQIKDWWQHYKDDTMAVNLAMKEFGISRAQAYNYLNDAKSLYCLFMEFNPLTELYLLKERIDRGFKLAEENPKAFGRLYGDCMRANESWIEKMGAELARQRPEEPRVIIFNYHMDWRELGVTEDQMADWKQRLEKVKTKVLKRNTEEITDAEYTTE